MKDLFCPCMSILFPVQKFNGNSPVLLNVCEKLKWVSAICGICAVMNRMQVIKFSAKRHIYLSSQCIKKITIIDCYIGQLILIWNCC